MRYNDKIGTYADDGGTVMRKSIPAPSADPTGRDAALPALTADRIGLHLLMRTRRVRSLGRKRFLIPLSALAVLLTGKML